MKAVLDLIPSDKGYVQVLGEDIRSARKHVAYVPQRSDIDWDFPITVLDVVLIGTYPSLGMMKRPKKEHRDWAFECLKRSAWKSLKIAKLVSFQVDNNNVSFSESISTKGGDILLR